MDGVLVVDKPSGPTSHDVVAAARHALGLRKAGHLGTLDPLATGVLPLVVGRATRLASLFAEARKQYDAVIRLGLITDSFDITGSIVGGSGAGLLDPSSQTRAAWPDAGVISAAAEDFVGSYLQRPPPVSAKKIGGVRAYELARRHQPVEISPVPVTVESLTLLAVEAHRVRCRVVCSSGFYVRSLAHDLGGKLGCGGCLETLRRERHGPFRLDDAVPLEALMDAGDAVAARLVPMRDLLPDLPRVVVNALGARRAAHGNPLGPGELVVASLPTDLAGARIRVLDETGRLLAIAESGADGVLRPKIVLV
ncbi:tRNA pseudouridine synthase B [Geodia barretti]|uniref:tRNA pseudouridine(55) synthase n=1 Tax=Geodia barretti TaxID=519541 RepID=A0AA35R6E6_GEOBA|nr:tRNA pseudouridine synthase B [Geodia barretti]